MKIYNISNFENIKQDEKKRVAALGFFDGVHRAHKQIIEGMLKEKNNDFVPVVVTLDRSPKEYFGKIKEESLTPLTKKSEIFQELGVEEVYYLEFNEKLQHLSADSFINNILKKLNISKIYCGYDYKFGNMGLGDPSLIEKSGIEVDVHTKEEIDNKKISTTVLKEFVTHGNFGDYYKFAGRYYSIKGEVVKGRQLGRTINFPTANLDLKEKYIIPQDAGVYITKTKVNGKMYKSITNIGYNPTVSDGKDRKFIETHILEFNKDIYGEEIEVFFYEFLRPERKFESFNHLKEQLQKDKKVCEEKNI